MKNSRIPYISAEIYKFPYCGIKGDTKQYLSDRIDCYLIRIRKKISRKSKRIFVYWQVILSVTNGVLPTQAIGLPILSNPPVMRRYILSNAGLSKKAIISRAIINMPYDIVFTEREIDQLYDLSINYRNNLISRQELIDKLTKLKGGDGFTYLQMTANLAGSLAFIGLIIFIAMQGDTIFHHNADAFVPPHLQWLHPNRFPRDPFGYGKSSDPINTKVRDVTQNAGSDQKKPSGSWDYIKTIKELDSKSKQRNVEIEVGGEIYRFKNPERESYILIDKLSAAIYESIRASDTDICDIAENLGFKAENIKNVKDHVFDNKHCLDKYDDDIIYERFDPNLQQAFAWKRLEAGIHTPDDITWIKHECAERHHELTYGSGYTQAHDRAQSRFDGAPWNDKW